MGCGSDINCFSVNSGKLVANYIGDENFGRIVNLCFHPSDDKVLVAIHLNGVIVFWNLIGTHAAKVLKHQVMLFKFITGIHNNFIYIFFSGIGFKRMLSNKWKMFSKNTLHV